MPDGSFINIEGGTVRPFHLQLFEGLEPPPPPEKIPPKEIGDHVLLKRTPNFLVITGPKHYLEQGHVHQDRSGTDFRRLYIVPVAFDSRANFDRAQQILSSAAQAHQIPSEFRTVQDTFGYNHMAQWIRLDFSQENWEDFILHDPAVVPGQIEPDTLPSLARLQASFDAGKTSYL